MQVCPWALSRVAQPMPSQWHWASPLTSTTPSTLPHRRLTSSCRWDTACHTMAGAFQLPEAVRVETLMNLLSCIESSERCLAYPSIMLTACHNGCVVQGHTVDVDTALVSTSEVKNYHMILLLGIGECVCKDWQDSCCIGWCIAVLDYRQHVHVPTCTIQPPSRPSWAQSS